MGTYGGADAGADCGIRPDAGAGAGFAACCACGSSSKIAFLIRSMNGMRHSHFFVTAPRPQAYVPLRNRGQKTHHKAQEDRPFNTISAGGAADAVSQ